MIKIKNKHKDPAEPSDIYIGRGSPLGNPWSHMDGTKAKYKVKTREEAVGKYRIWFKEQIRSGNPQVCNAFNEIFIRYLKKEDFGLMCYCQPLLCHGHVLIEEVEKTRWVANWFSNMRSFDEPLYYQGIAFNAPENFYQAMKIDKDDVFLRKHIASMYPQASKKTIRQYGLREDWTQEMALKVMRYALEHKFAPGTSWRKKLDNTEGSYIVEWNNWNDTFWGKDIFSEEGENHLGKILMSIRDEEGR
jgi:ribA/ribD-fused uncharacterized protein